MNSKDFYDKGTSKNYLDQVVPYIADVVTKSILKRSKCFAYPLLLSEDSSQSALINQKNRGVLMKPSDNIINVCKIIERCFKAVLHL